MKEDLAEWLNNLYPDLYINVDNFMDRLDTGVALCKHANSVRKYAEEYVNRRQSQGKIGKSSAAIAASVLQLNSVRFFPGAKPGTFFARDNVSNFISWCRRGLGVFECLLFETDDLIMRKNEKHVILCLLEVARRGAKLGMPAPMLVQLEREIDREIAADKREFQRGLSATQGYDFDDDDDESDLSDMEDCRQYGPLPQIVTNDLKSLDEMVRDLVERCRCPTQFPMIRVSEGKYRIGDTKVLIFVRVLRSHVMVRVGGGWDTLSHYLDKHDPCRCKTAHRAPISAKVVNMKLGIPAADIAGALVHYDRSPPRTRRSSASSVGSNGGGINSLTPSTPSASVRNRSHSPAARENNNLSVAGRSSVDRETGMRSRSPTPRRTLTPAARSSVERELTSHSPADSRKLSPARQDRGRNRSRSPTPRRLTPNRADRNRSRSPTPRRQVTTSRPSTPSINHHRSRSPSPKRINLETTESVETDQNKLDAENSDSLVKANICQHSRSLTPLADFSSVNVTEGNLVNEAVSILQATSEVDASAPEDTEIGSDTNVDKVKNDVSIDTTDSLKITDNVISELTKALKEDAAVVDSTPSRKISEHFTSTPTRSVNDDDSGVDTSPCHKISDNFINHPTRSHSVDHQRYSDVQRKISPAVQEYESGVDTSPSHRVSDNFTHQHRVSVTVRQSPTTVTEVTSGVDTMPFRKVSDNFEPSDFAGTHHHTGRRYLPGNKFGSASALDSLGNDSQANNDSGSEVSDEGYRSLGIVTTPPATASQKAGPSPKGSPVRAARTARSRSVGGGGHETVSPQQSPFRRNTPVNRSARISSSAATPATRSSATSYNTWNSGGGRSGKKQRPSLSADTFCQQVADIMQQYAAMMPSPRKDSKPDSGVTTRIPAPVQRT